MFFFQSREQNWYIKKGYLVKLNNFLNSIKTSIYTIIDDQPIAGQCVNEMELILFNATS